MKTRLVSHYNQECDRPHFIALTLSIPLSSLLLSHVTKVYDLFSTQGTESKLPKSSFFTMWLINDSSSFVSVFLTHLQTSSGVVLDHPEPCLTQLCNARLQYFLRKTIICKQWQAGRCRYPVEECKFAHGRAELKPLPKYELCKRHKNGACPLKADKVRICSELITEAGGIGLLVDVHQIPEHYHIL